MANAVLLPIYRVNGSNELQSPIPTYFAFPTSGVFAEPVSTPNNNVKGALIYSRIKSTATGSNEYYSTLTVAAIVTALG